jgi:hypothetical protein
MLKWSTGQVPQKAIDALRPCRGDDAAHFQGDAVRLLINAGFVVSTEMEVQYERGNGRIDVLAQGEGTKVWIELDRKSVRKKSVQKIEAAIAREGGCGLVVCREE